MFGPKLLEEYHSKFSGKLEVQQTLNDRYLSTGYWTQSGGIIIDVWKPVFKKIKPNKNSKWLILGLAAGTVCKLIPQPQKIVGVEIDPLMLDIAKKYFGLDKIKNLKIINSNAKSYVSHITSKFDYILVDLYLGDQIPKFVYTKIFLDKLKHLGRLVIFNHLFFTPVQKKLALGLVEKLKKFFSKVETVRSLTNLLIICS